MQKANHLHLTQVVTATGFIADPPAKLRRIARSFRFHLGQAGALSPRCNAPWVSAVLELNGSVRPCFFHPPIGNVNGSTLAAVLTGPQVTRFRDTLNVAANPTCQRCVCSLHYKENSPAHTVDEAVSV